MNGAGLPKWHGIVCTYEKISMNLNAPAGLTGYLYASKTFADKPELTRMLNELDAEQFDQFCKTLRQRTVRVEHIRNINEPLTDGEISFDKPVSIAS